MSISLPSDDADLIRQFISDGNQYMTWANMAWIPGMPAHPNEPPNPDGAFAQFGKGIDDPNSWESQTLRRAYDAQKRQTEYRSKLLHNGPILAKALKHHGHEAKPLLAFLHGIDRAESTARALWMPLKVYLQDLLIPGPEKERPADKASGEARAAVSSALALTTDSVVKQLENDLVGCAVHTSKDARKWCDDHKIKGYSRDEWKAAFGSDPPTVRGQPTYYNSADVLRAIATENEAVGKALDAKVEYRQRAQAVKSAYNPDLDADNC